MNEDMSEYILLNPALSKMSGCNQQNNIQKSSNLHKGSAQQKVLGVRPSNLISFAKNL